MDFETGPGLVAYYNEGRRPTMLKAKRLAPDGPGRYHGLVSGVSEYSLREILRIERGLWPDGFWF